MELSEIAVWTLTALKSLNRILAAESSQKERRILGFHRDRVNAAKEGTTIEMWH